MPFTAAIKAIIESLDEPLALAGQPIEPYKADPLDKNLAISLKESEDVEIRAGDDDGDEPEPEDTE